MKASLLVLLFIFGSIAQLSYAPLSSKQRSSFIKASKAIFVAESDSNVDGILRFAPVILNDYQCILLDPKSKDLRDRYKRIEAIYTSITITSKTDSLEKSVTQHFATQKYLNCLQTYQTFYPQVAKSSDSSLIFLHRKQIKICMKELFNERPTYDTYNVLAKLSVIDKKYLDTLRMDLEEQSSTILLNLSSTTSIDTLLNFKRNFPGLYESDVNNLIDAYRAKWRLRIRRKPRIEDIEHYLRYFPMKDPFLDTLYENALYSEFKQKLSQVAAMKYLSNFPDGKYRIEIQDFYKLYEKMQTDSSYAVVADTLLR